MIKKYFNLPILSQARRQLCVQTKVGSMSKTRLSEHFNQCLISKKYESKGNAAIATIAITALLLLQGVMVLPAQAASAAKTGQRVLMIEMTPALCSLQPTRARMRQCLEGYSLTVSGLDMGYGERCGRGSEPRLTPLQLKVVNRIMPDTTVRTQAW